MSGQWLQSPTLSTGEAKGASEVTKQCCKTVGLSVASVIRMPVYTDSLVRAFLN